MSSGPQGLGASLSASDLADALDHFFKTNAQSAAHGAWPTPVCIWGRHGIGKTMLVEHWAKKAGFHFATCAPAQFEEMGDLNGMPVVEDGVTRFATPAWVPQQQGPGILLLDDVNRADDRILRGLMQLLQTGGLVAWQLPKGWQIVATANPDDGDYSVTPMDDAMLTRMHHVSMQFHAPSWERWARKEEIDSRGIDFVMSHPELAVGRRTTPRSLAAFFRAIKSIKDLTASAQLVETLAHSALDPSTVGAFMAFIARGTERMPSPDEILNAKDLAPILDDVARLAEDGERADRVGVLLDRLTDRAAEGLKKAQGANLKRFLLEAKLPTDLRMSFHRNLTATKNKGVQQAIAGPEVARALLGEL